jgi:hypothetical protein
MVRFAQEPVIIALKGSFDASALRCVRAEISGLAQGVPVILDFSHTRELSDLALSLLIPQTQELDRSVTLRGLRQHHHTLLRYLGAPPSEARM